MFIRPEWYSCCKTHHNRLCCICGVFGRRHVELRVCRGERCRFIWTSRLRSLSISSFCAILPPSLTLIAPCFHFPWPRSQPEPRQESRRATERDWAKLQATRSCFSFLKFSLWVFFLSFSAFFWTISCSYRFSETLSVIFEQSIYDTVDKMSENGEKQFPECRYLKSEWIIIIIVITFLSTDTFLSQNSAESGFTLFLSRKLSLSCLRVIKPFVLIKFN